MSVPYTKSNTKDGRHLDNRDDVRFDMDSPIWMTFVKPMQNDMPMSMKWSESEPEVEIQYDDRLFSETESSYISVANWRLLRNMV